MERRTESHYVSLLNQFVKDEMDVRPHISLRQARRQIRLKQPALWDAAFVDDPGERVRRAVEFEMLKNGVGERDALAAVQLRLNINNKMGLLFPAS